MDSKTAEYLTKLMLEDDEEDVVSFAFPNEKRRIKCSISMLSEISPVFEAMFSERWREQQSDDNQMASVPSVLQDKTMKLDDDVTFNQYVTFKILMQILYGLRQMDSLSVDQAIGIYFYSHKYQIKDVQDKIQKFLNERMASGMSKLPLSLNELTEGIEFAQLYQLDEFKEMLDQVKLAFDEKNLIQFWDLANKFEMENLKKQVLDQLKTVTPQEDWTPDILRVVVECLQADREVMKTKLEEVNLMKCPNCQSQYTLSCRRHCGYGGSLSSIIPNL